jgi:hypothetical protein
MLVIRSEQLEVFSQAMQDRFVEQMVRHLTTDFPSEVRGLGVDRAGLEGLVRQGIVQAREYGIEYDDDLQLYLDCMVLLGPQFNADPRYPWAATILNDGDKDGETKMAEISQYLQFGLEDRK